MGTACSGAKRNADGDIVTNDGKICRYEKTTGSHIGTKICRTPEQIKVEKEAAKKALRNLNQGQVSGSQ